MPKKDAVCSATLIILGDDLNPDVITDALGLQPSQAWRRGDNHSSVKADGTVRVCETIHKWGGWKRWLEGDLRDMPLTTQLLHWADLLTEQASFISGLTEKGCAVEMNCCVITEASVVIQVPAQIQQKFGELGVDLDVTFYAHQSKMKAKSRSPAKRTFR